MILASGPSLTREDVEFVRGKAKVIAINCCYQLAPFADVFYACDARFWKHHWPQMKHLPGLKYSLQVPGAKKPDPVICLRKTGRSGLELDPSGLRHGHNSGMQALGLAFHLGASRILLLGYDMGLGSGGKQHWHPNHPWSSASNYNAWIRLFDTLVEPLRAAGVEVINCTRSTNLNCFPRGDLRTLLAEREVAA